MIPIPGLEEIKVQWLLIEKGGYKLYGFLLYTCTDTVLVEYLKNGLTELDVLSGDKCAIFLIEPPSKKWITYARKKGHLWLSLFLPDGTRNAVEEMNDTEATHQQVVNTLIANNANSVIVVGDHVKVTLNQLLDPEYNELYDRTEAISVARHFNLKASDIPCLIFFKNLEGNVIWNKSLDGYQTIRDLNNFFRGFFESDDFKSLLNY